MKLLRAPKIAQKLKIVTEKRVAMNALLQEKEFGRGSPNIHDE